MKIILSILYISFSINVYAQNALIDKGNQFYNQSQYSLAEVQYTIALKDSPSSITAQYNLASALHKQKKWDQALAGFDKVIAAAKEDKIKAAAWYNKGVAYSQQKSLEESIDAYKAALRLNPEDDNARENLQKALIELKKKQQEEQKRQQQKPKISQPQAQQKLKQLEQKQQDTRNRLQNKNKSGAPQKQDW